MVYRNAFLGRPRGGGVKPQLMKFNRLGYPVPVLPKMVGGKLLYKVNHHIMNAMRPLGALMLPKGTTFKGSGTKPIPRSITTKTKKAITQSPMSMDKRARVEAELKRALR